MHASVAPPGALAAHAVRRRRAVARAAAAPPTAASLLLLLLTRLAAAWCPWPSPRGAWLLGAGRSPPRKGRTSLQAAALLPELADLEACAEAGRPEDARSLFARVEASWPESRAELLHSLVLRAHAEGGDVRGAVSWCERMRDAGVPVADDDVTRLCAAAATAGTLKAWLRASDSLGLRMTLDRYRAVVQAYIARGDMRRAGAWLQRMSDEGTQPDADLLREMILACGRHGFPRRANRYLDELAELGVEIDHPVFSALVAAHSAQGNATGAFHWFLQMQQAALSPTVVEYTALIDCCARNGDVEGAEQWFNRMQEAGITADGQTYLALIRADLGRRRNGLRAAERRLRSMERAEVRPPAEVFEVLIDAHASAAEVAEAERWFEEMKAQGHSPTLAAYEGLLRACGRAGWTARAEGWLEATEAAGFKLGPASYDAMVQAYANSGRTGDARRWLESMGKRRFKPALASFHALLADCEKTLDAGFAVSCLRRIKEAGRVPDASVYARVLAACAARHHPDPGVARLVLAEAVQAGVSVDGPILAGLRAILGEDGAKALCEELGASVDAAAQRGARGGGPAGPPRASSGAVPARRRGPGPPPLREGITPREVLGTLERRPVERTARDFW